MLRTCAGSDPPEPASWFGALVAPEQPEEGQWILGFDDGDIKRYETSFLLTCLQHSALNKL